jgi:peptidyl-prolyl cis-trans isomerase B (cyclophilin B)
MSLLALVPLFLMSASQDEPKVAKKPVAVMTTTLGVIELEFFPEKAPKHVENFIALAKKGFYDKLAFHRVIPGFMVQGGCPNTKPGATGMPGTGGPGFKVKAEFNDTKHVRGILSMARSSDPDSAGSQFFIMVADAPHLDRQYSAFGRVIKGMDVVDKIVKSERDERDNPKTRVEMTVKIEER